MKIGLRRSVIGIPLDTLISRCCGVLFQGYNSLLYRRRSPWPCSLAARRPAAGLRAWDRLISVKGTAGFQGFSGAWLSLLCAVPRLGRPRDPSGYGMPRANRTLKRMWTQRFLTIAL